MTTHEYYIKNKEKIKEKHKLWRKNNPNYAKEYNDKNRKKLLEYRKSWRRKKGIGFQNPRWTEEEINYLVKNYEFGDKKEMITKLKRTWRAITTKADRIGIKRKIRINLGKNNGQWKGGINIDYYQRIARENLTHKCNICGKDKFGKNEMQIHHIDRNRLNNNLDNLVILCRKCHFNLHKNINELERGNNCIDCGRSIIKKSLRCFECNIDFIRSKLKAPMEKTCLYCNKKFKRWGGNINQKFCSRECYSKFRTIREKNPTLNEIRGLINGL